MKLSTFLLKLSVTATLVTVGTAAIDSSTPALAEQNSLNAFTENSDLVTPATPTALYLVIGGVIAGVILLKPRIVRVRRDEVGIVSKKFGRPLPSNRQIAVNGEMGIQIGVLNPGRHYLFPFWMYKVTKDKAIQIDTDEIGLVIAKDGAALLPGKMLGKI